MRKISLYEAMNIEHMMEKGATVADIATMYDTTEDVISAIVTLSDNDLLPNHKKDMYLDVYLCADLLDKHKVVAPKKSRKSGGNE